MSKNRKPPRGPFFRNRVEAARRRIIQKESLLARSPKTGLLHHFQDAEAWQQVSERMEADFAAQKEQVLFSSLPFAHHIKSLTISNSHISRKCPEILYRFANPRYGPLAVDGNLANGGRFNVGGAQISKHFPDIQIGACLYTASTRSCADIEAARPIGVQKMYELRPKTKLIFWDLAKVIGVIGYPNLLDEVKKSNGEAIWGLQKVPTISQILAHHLRKIGGDGIVFESTKSPPDLNVIIFVKDTEHANSLFESKQI